METLGKANRTASALLSHAGTASALLSHAGTASASLVEEGSHNGSPNGGIIGYRDIHLMEPILKDVADAYAEQVPSGESFIGSNLVHSIVDIARKRCV